MKFYNSIGPNPHVVRMFMAEKGLTIPSQDVDLRAGDNRKPEHLALCVKFITDVKDRKKLLMGFGHRVYKNYDPRAKIVKKVRIWFNLNPY